MLENPHSDSSACCATGWESWKTASLPRVFLGSGFCSSPCCSPQPPWRAENIITYPPAPKGCWTRATFTFAVKMAARYS